jgi:hypothetical protein
VVLPFPQQAKQFTFPRPLQAEQVLTVVCPPAVVVWQPRPRHDEQFWRLVPKQMWQFTHPRPLQRLQGSDTCCGGGTRSLITRWPGFEVAGGRLEPDQPWLQP